MPHGYAAPGDGRTRMSRRIPHPHPQGHGRSPNYLWMALGQARARHSRHASARMDARPQAHSHAANPAGCWVLRPAQEQAGKTTGTPAGCHIAKPANFPKAKKPRRSGHEALVVGCPYGINEEFVTVEVRTGSQQQKRSFHALLLLTWLAVSEHTYETPQPPTAENFT